MAPSDCKVMAIRNAPLPRTKKQVRYILGLASYYSRFIPHYADTARLLHQATCKAAPDRVVWCNELIECFHTLQSSLTSNYLLTLPILSDEFFLQTDRHLWSWTRSCVEHCQGRGGVACCLLVQKFEKLGEEILGVRTGMPRHCRWDPLFRSVLEASTLCGID